MDTHEVREAVLATATAEARVNKRLADRNDWAKRRFVGVHLFLQAVPLVAPPTNWEVLSQGFSEIVRGNHRRNLPDLKYFDLSSQYSPVPTIEGVHGGVRSGDPNRWRLDVFRDGYISLCVENTQTYSVGGHLNPREVYALDQEWGEVFLAFAKVINECIRYTGSDLPYAIAAVYRSAQLTCLCVGRNNFVGPYEEDEILWPNHIRNVGEDAEIIAKQQLVEMFHAYGRQLPGAS